MGSTEVIRKSRRMLTDAELAALIRQYMTALEQGESQAKDALGRRLSQALHERWPRLFTND